jgi:vacuolar protein 8
VQIVEFGGLFLLIPLTRSLDEEVVRLACHALANLSVNADNQRLMAAEGAVEALVALLDAPSELVQRQAAKALANLGVNGENKGLIAQRGGIPRLVALALGGAVPVKIEAVAALANLAVNDANELEIVRVGGLDPIIQGTALCAEGLGFEPRGGGGKTDRELSLLEELATQCCRALRNLSVNPANKAEIAATGVGKHLLLLSNYNNERIAQQARRAIKNLDNNSSSSSSSSAK